MLSRCRCTNKRNLWFTTNRWSFALFLFDWKQISNDSYWLLRFSQSAFSINSHTHANSIDKSKGLFYLTCFTYAHLCVCRQKKTNGIALVSFCYILIFEIWTIFSSRLLCHVACNTLFLAPFLTHCMFSSSFRSQKKIRWNSIYLKECDTSYVESKLSGLTWNFQVVHAFDIFKKQRKSNVEMS